MFIALRESMGPIRLYLIRLVALASLISSAEAMSWKIKDWCGVVMRALHPNFLEMDHKDFDGANDNLFLEGVLRLSSKETAPISAFQTARDYFLKSTSRHFPGNFQLLDVRTIPRWQSEWGISEVSLLSKDFLAKDDTKFNASTTVYAVSRRNNPKPIGLIAIYRPEAQSERAKGGERIVQKAYRILSSGDLELVTARSEQIEIIPTLRP
jgi:hypothetical protein